MKIETAPVGRGKRTKDFNKNNLYNKHLITTQNLSEQNFPQNTFKIDLGFALKKNSVRKDDLSNADSLYFEGALAVDNQFTVGNKIRKR